MTYTVKTKFPKEITEREAKEIVNTHDESETNLDTEDVLSLYAHYQQSGYNIKATFKLQEDADPVTVASKLDEHDIAYKATLKFLNKANRGSYDEVLPISQIAFQQGYDYEVGVTLKINDESTVDFDKESTWFSPEDAIYIVKPKVSGKHLTEMIPIYERLLDQGVDVTFDIKPSSAETDDDFSKQLSAYPEGTEITMVLSDSEY